MVQVLEIKSKSEVSSVPGIGYMVCDKAKFYDFLKEW